MIIDTIKNLKKVYKYSDKTISNEDIQYILDAGKSSQANGNKLLCIFGIIDDKNLITQLSKCCGGNRWIQTAPVVIAICTARMTHEDIETERFKLGKLKDDIYDIDSNVLDIICANGHQSLIAAQNMVLAACERGIGSCIVSNIDVYKASKLLKIPNSHLVTYLITIGYESGNSQKNETNTDNCIVFNNIYDI